MLTLAELAAGSGSVGLSEAKRLERIRIEHEHDPEAMPASFDMHDTPQYLREIADHADRCPCCGEVIDEVDKCPFCKSQQRFVGQRNSAQRKTIGGFCKGKK